MAVAGEVTITKLDHEGAATLQYRGEIVYADEATCVARCPWPLPRTVDLGPFRIEPGDIFVEFYYADEWFNIFAIYESTGVLKGWYCNITGDVALSEGDIRWRDLALDYLVTPDGRAMTLDRGEFDARALAAVERARAERALDTLAAWVAQGHYPFPPSPAPPSGGS